MLPAHRSSIQKQSLPFLHDARYAMTIRIHYVHRNPVFDNTWWYANQGFVDGSPSVKRRQKSRGTARETAMLKDIQTWWDMYGTVTTVSVRPWWRRWCADFLWGWPSMTGGCARATSFSFLFFFSSLFSPLSPPVRWERKPDRGSLRPLSDRPAPLRHRECKREEETEYEGWTERTGVNRLNLPTPYRHVLRAMRDF